MSRVFIYSGLGKKRRLVGIDEETSEAGVGAINLDVAMCRDHGWTEKQIVRAFLAIKALSVKESRIAERKHPELYKVEHGETIFVGPSTRRVGPR